MVVFDELCVLCLFCVHVLLVCVLMIDVVFANVCLFACLNLCCIVI